MGRAILLFALCVLPALVAAARPARTQFEVEGCVYCDHCRAGFETQKTSYIAGARVRLECKNRQTMELVYGKEATTDSSGTYKIRVNEDHQDQICDTMLVSSPRADCRNPSSGRDRARVVLTNNNGIASNKRYANSMGFEVEEVLLMVPLKTSRRANKQFSYANKMTSKKTGRRITKEGKGMASAAFHQAIGTLQHLPNSQEFGGVPLKSILQCSKVDFGLSMSRKVGHRRCFSVVQASASKTSLVDPVSTPSNGTTTEIKKKSSEAALILIRHGESLWNEKNLFTGCVDVPLTKKGVEEAIEAGKRISNIPIDMIYTSALIRAQMTAMLAMTQHRRRKVPIIMHNESQQANAWSQIFSEETLKQSIPVITGWQLNERMYGELQGLNKQETADRFGKEKVHEWRRSYDIPPPNGESLEMCAERAVAYFKDQIETQLLSGKNVMIAAHGNSLRSIIMYLDKLTSQEVISLELSTGIPMLYIFKEGRFIRRGSPAAPTEAGVYAYTRRLAQYRQKLDEMLH